MAISLYPHNATAYEAAVSMLSETGKAAIIHPTGTGKSFIAFKLVEDHPNDRFLWLAPSAYIFETQLQNLQKQSGDPAPENITFLTYAKLSMMTDAELRELKPDWMILDEYHRTGAEVWQKNVFKLLAIYPDVPVLGLTATSIRFLDNQRDMGEEVFDNHIASQMTLGEAIVRGILTPPKYVLSVYRYQQSLEKLQLRVRKAKSKASRYAAQEEFEKLRRAIENSIGLPEIFQKHMPDDHGKYLVFCSNAEHMDEMIAKVPEWFGAIDSAPHIYRAYAEDPSTYKAFESFKTDNSSHLKLLFCIDMLNEGVHISDVNGVILLRPTISPIVYKQQIGRALSATNNSHLPENAPVIFDVVLNIENLCSISTIQQEMQAAITYYHYLGEDNFIINDHFEVIDEVRDCRKLFDELERSLNGTWDLMYAEAKKYYLAHGDLLIPAKYKTETGLSLGSWLQTQRKIYHGRAIGHLSEEQVNLLNNIGIVWDSWRDLSWERNYLAAKEYYEQHGDLLPPLNYVTPSGILLGLWVATMRTCRANRQFNKVTPERIQKLDAIGMVWNNLVSEQWEKNYLEAAEYYKQHGDLRIPVRYVSPSGVKLGNWIVHLRMARKGTGKYNLTSEQIARLNMIGMVWDAIEDSWNTGFENARLYYLDHGNLKIPAKYVTPSGFPLGVWIGKQRGRLKKGQISQAQIERLNSIGMLWDVVPEVWQKAFEEAEAYYNTHGTVKVPRSYKAPSGRNLDCWLQKQKRERDRLSPSQLESLRSLDLDV